MTAEPQDTKAEPLLLLADCTGAYYAIPMSVAEAHQAPAAMVESVRRQLAEEQEKTEVSGYGPFIASAQSFVSQTPQRRLIPFDPSSRVGLTGGNPNFSGFG